MWEGGGASFPLNHRTSLWIFKKTVRNFMLLDSTPTSYVSMFSKKNNDLVECTNIWGVERCLASRYDKVRHDTARYDKTWHITTWHDLTRHETTRLNTTWHDTTRHGTRHDIAWYDTTWHNLTRLYTTWYDTTRLATTWHDTTLTILHWNDVRMVIYLGQMCNFCTCSCSVGC
jgi:hypothetical protein